MVKRKPIKIKRKNPLFGSKNNPLIFSEILKQEKLVLSILSSIKWKVEDLSAESKYAEKQQDYKTAEKIQKLFAKLNVKLTDLEEWL